jgi:serine phosphatase RsbU (regulator of sigma subunit)
MSGSAPAEIIEYKADKMPIGTYLETEIPFKSTAVALQKGDIIYLSTDGYADQFGGDKGKKLKYKPFMDLLIGVSKDTMNAQKTALEKAFEDWRKQYEQVDDVSIIGIRV